jgi:hypothetical protein
MTGSPSDSEAHDFGKSGGIPLWPMRSFAVDDDAVRRGFGEPVIDFLGLHGFREVGKTGDRDGWFTRTYQNNDLSLRLVAHLGWNIEVGPQDEPGATSDISQVAEFLGDPLRFRSPVPDQLRYAEANYARLKRLFSADDRTQYRAFKEFLYKKGVLFPEADR